uniref:Unconventional myosin-XVI-like n=1 Tax=Sinocyclocheilus rhinocerous TaxID=307959 RepID=A0A673KF40_9TELE
QARISFLKCCFQLCNVFRQNMEIDQCLLESLPLGQRQRLVRRMRCEQLRVYYERERTLQKQSFPKPRSTNRKKQRISFTLSDVIQDAIIRHDDKEVLRLLKEGADLNTVISSGGSLLHLCARHDNVFAAEILIEKGLNVNLQDEDLWTALHVACACDHADMVLLLLLAGVNVLLQDVNGNIPLDYATEGTETSYILIRHLEENGRILHSFSSLFIKVQVSDNSFWTPLHLAAKYGQTHIVSQLLKHKADPTLLNCNQDKPSGTNTHKSCTSGQPIQRFLATMTLPISRRDSLLEKEAMFRDSGGALTQQPSLDNGLDGPYPSAAGKLEQVKLMPPAPNDDLASLSELTDSSLLYEMQKRFANDQIYTYIGHILLLINPYKDLPIYSNLVSQLYLSSSGRLCSSLPPHIFSSAERAYHMMLQERRPQCFIISGESGSGKSVACKHILKHLAARSSPKGFALEPRMKHVNVILEAFGHAETQMNSSASRFINLISLQYCEKRKTLLRGSRLYTYMLEKSRVICTPPHQKNFNIFYLMAEGLSAEEKSNLYLNNVLAHRCMNTAAPGQTPAVATACPQSREKLSALKQAVRALGFNRLEVENLFVVLSALLHLGDVRFTALTDADTAFVSDLQLLDRVAGMLQVSSEDLGSALTSDVQCFKGDVITRRHTVEMSNRHRDLLAKALYGRLFSFLINSVNFYLQGHEDSTGILDIFGFEEFQRNGYEQLCVNIVNERIRQFTADVLFQQEQQECLQEGVAMETLRSLGNQTAVLDFFFQKPQGVLCIIDEESQSLRPCEVNLYKRLQIQLDSSGLDAVSLTTKDGNGNPPPKDQGPSFTVTHYAGKVTYDLTGSLDKNKDVLPQNILFVMKTSENVLIHQMFQCKLTQTGSLVPHHQRLKLRGPKGTLLNKSTTLNPARDAKKYVELNKLLKKKGATSFLQRLERCGPVTVAVQLRNSLCEINSKLQACTPHFVQCVRPNNAGKPDVFDSFHVSSQLQYVGVLEMVRMIRYGYPVRLSFTSFLSRYRELVDTILTDRKKASAEEKCRHILQHCKLQGWQMGNSKVFLRYWQADHLNDRCHQLHRKIIVCQKVVRGWLARQCARRRLTSRQKEQCNIQRFLQGAEDLGMCAYDSLVIQNAADIARENDRLRGHISAPPLGERPEPVGRGGNRPLRHFRSSSVPLPLVMDSLVHSSIGTSIKAALQPAPHSTEEGNGGSLSSPRKQPPPKPKRDPNTRLSASYEAVSAGLSIAPKDSPAEALSKPRPHSDDYSTMKKIPPPKPKRSPNTKLTGSYEEISVPSPARPTDMKLVSLLRGGHCLGLIQRAASADGPHSSVLSLYPCQDEEDVYIEMVGASRALRLADSQSPELGEAVYEEMKYFPPDEVGLAPVVKPEAVNPTTTILPAPVLEIKRPVTLMEHSGTLGGKQQGKDGTACDIPAPFPNLLQHRPPLLVFPPSPVTCSPASDESPLTPLEVKKLPVFETNLNYTSQDGGSPLSPQYTRQRADSSPSLSVLMPDKSTPPLTPPPPPAALPPPYRPPSHFPFPPEPNVLALTRAASVATTDSPKVSHKIGHGLAETPPSSSKPPFSPVKTSRPEPRRAHSCSSSPLLFNPANGRPLTSPLDELNTLFSSGRSLLRKSTTGRKIRDSGECMCSGTCPISPSAQLQDKNANNHTSPNSSNPAPIENGNQISNGNGTQEVKGDEACKDCTPNTGSHSLMYIRYKSFAIACF